MNYLSYLDNINGGLLNTYASKLYNQNDVTTPNSYNGYNYNSASDVSGVIPRINNMYGNEPMVNIYPASSNMMPGNVTGVMPNMPNMQNSALNDALNTIKSSVLDEANDVAFYNYLISKAPNKDKEIIMDIRDDEKKHNEYLRRIYRDFTGITLKEVPANNVTFNMPYSEALQKAFLAELLAAKKYRNIMAVMPKNLLGDVLFEIMTDEMMHAMKYLFLMITSKADREIKENTSMRKAEENEI